MAREVLDTNHHVPDQKHHLPLPNLYLVDGTLLQDNLWDFQEAFLECMAKFVCLGGSFGAGKTLAMLLRLLEELWYYPDNFGLIMRKDLPRLKKSAEKDFIQLVPSWMMIERNKNEGTFDVMNAYGFEAMEEDPDNWDLPKREKRELLDEVHGTSQIVFTSFEGTAQALTKFRSQNLGFYCIEQAEEGAIEIYDVLIDRLRKVPSSRRAYFVANPNGHDWIWHLFHPDSPDKRRNHEMIIGDTLDNKSLPPDYFDTLDEVYTEEQKQRYLYSSWDVAPMSYFPEFSANYHVIPHQDPGDTWEKGVGLDHGVDHPTAVVYGAWMPSGELYIYDEYYEKGKIVSDHVEAILPKVTEEHTVFMIDPSTNQRSGVGLTVVDQYAMLGLPFVGSSRDVNAGITRIKEYMKYDEGRINPWTANQGSPRLFISERCVNLIRELPLYQKAEQKANIGHEAPPDKPRKKDDDTVDALRYLMMGFVEPLTAASEAVDAPKVARKMPFKGVEGKKNTVVKVKPVFDKHGKQIDDESGMKGVHFSISDLISESNKPVSPKRTVWKRVNGVAVQARNA